MDDAVFVRLGMLGFFLVTTPLKPDVLQEPQDAFCAEVRH